MNNFQALQSFWESFGVDAYDEQTVFTAGQRPAYPHITYESFSGTWEARRTMSANLWNRSTSWFRIPEYTPFAQVIASGSEDDLVKRILLSIEVEFLTVR